MGKILNWRRDKMINKIKNLPKNAHKGGRPSEVDKKVWKILVKKVEEEEAQRESTTKPS